MSGEKVKNAKPCPWDSRPYNGLIWGMGTAPYPPGKVYFVYCLDCESRGPTGFSKQEALKNWDDRDGNQGS